MSTSKSFEQKFRKRETTARRRTKRQNSKRNWKWSGMNCGHRMSAPNWNSIIRTNRTIMSPVTTDTGTMAKICRSPTTRIITKSWKCETPNGDCCANKIRRESSQTFISRRAVSFAKHPVSILSNWAHDSQLIIQNVTHLLVNRCRVRTFCRAAGQL